MSSSSDRYDGCLHLRSGVLAGVLAAIAVLQSPAAVSQPSGTSATGGAAPEVTALWQAHDVQFHYFGFRTYYSCAGLEDRLRQILRDLGAHPDVRVTAWGCMGLNDVNNMLTARIRVRMPTGSAASAADSFTATSEPVNLTTRRTGGFGSGDCELLEQVRDQLLPALNIPLVKDDLHCIPGQASLIAQSLQVQALVAVNDKE